MKTTDIAFAATLGTMLIASIAALGSLGTRPVYRAPAGVPTFQLERVVITGTKAAAARTEAAKRAAAAAAATVACSDTSATATSQC